MRRAGIVLGRHAARAAGSAAAALALPVPMHQLHPVFAGGGGGLRFLDLVAQLRQQLRGFGQQRVEALVLRLRNQLGVPLLVVHAQRLQPPLLHALQLGAAAGVERRNGVVGQPPPPQRRAGEVAAEVRGVRHSQGAEAAARVHNRQLPVQRRLRRERRLLRSEIRRARHRIRRQRLRLRRPPCRGRSDIAPRIRSSAPRRSSSRVARLSRRRGQRLTSARERSATAQQRQISQRVHARRRHGARRGRQRAAHVRLARHVIAQQTLRRKKAVAFALDGARQPQLVRRLLRAMPRQRAIAGQRSAQRGRRGSK